MRKISRPASHPPKISTGSRRCDGDGAVTAADMRPQCYREGIAISDAGLKARSLSRATACDGSILEAFAYRLNIVLDHDLSPGIQIGRCYPAIDLQIKLHDRPEALQKRLLTERTGERAGFEAFQDWRAEIITERADLAFLLGLGDCRDDRRRDRAIRSENADDIAARLEKSDDRARDVLIIDGYANLLRARVNREVGELAGGIEVLHHLIEGRNHAVVDFDIARSRLRGKQDGALVEPFVEHAFGQSGTSDRCCRSTLAGMADTVAHIDCRIEGIRRRYRNTLIEHLFDGVVVGAHLRRRQDQP